MPGNIGFPEILVVLIMLIESRDKSNVDHGGGQPQAERGA